MVFRTFLCRYEAPISLSIPKNDDILSHVDLGDINNEICILDHNGDILEKATIENTGSGFNIFFDRFESPREVKVAIETGTHSPWISQLLEARGFKVLIGNTRKLRAIWESDEKTDERDAKTHLAPQGANGEPRVAVVKFVRP